ncbi:hypothetical protein D046_5623B, partial [Vibrio parahaemolyticus V-223/04]
PRRA